MKQKLPFLCRVGLHRYHRYPTMRWFCKRCGKEMKQVRFYIR